MSPVGVFWFDLEPYTFQILRNTSETPVVCFFLLFLLFWEVVNVRKERENSEEEDGGKVGRRRTWGIS